MLFFFQVVNYGIAGQYEPHVDHALVNSTSVQSMDFFGWFSLLQNILGHLLFSLQTEKSAIFKMGMGNRIATVLIYVSTPYCQLACQLFVSMSDGRIVGAPFIDSQRHSEIFRFLSSNQNPVREITHTDTNYCRKRQA